MKAGSWEIVAITLSPDMTTAVVNFRRRVPLAGTQRRRVTWPIEAYGMVDTEGSPRALSLTLSGKFPINLSDCE